MEIGPRIIAARNFARSTRENVSEITAGVESRWPDDAAFGGSEMMIGGPDCDESGGWLVPPADTTTTLSGI